MIKKTVFGVSACYIIVFVAFNIFFNIAFAKGVSMEPTIPENEVLIYSNFESTNQDLTNKIVSYYSPENDITICHRVIEDNQDVIVCQGDNNEVADDPFSRTQIVAVLFGSCPFEIFCVLWIGFAVTGVLAVTILWSWTKNAEE